MLKDFSRLKMLVLYGDNLPDWLEQDRDGVAPMFHRDAVMDGSRRYLPVSVVTWEADPNIFV